jgi:uncharacterized protein YukE
MTEYAHHSDMRVDVQKELDGFRDKIKEGLDWVSDQWDGCIMDSGWGWLAPGPKAAYELAKNHVEGKMQELWDDFEEKCKQIWESVQEVTGDPFELMEMNQAYLDCAGRIRDEGIIMARLKTEVAEHWEGVSYNAYADLITEQSKALTGIDSGITQAATACAQGAQQINSIWNDVVKAILDYAGKVVGAIKDGTDVGQWVTLDLGPALKIILDAALAVAALALKLETYWAENATVKTDMWRRLNSGLPGLDANNDWPRVRYYTDKIDDKGGWGQK